MTPGLLLLGFAPHWATAEPLSPQLVQLDQLVLNADFSKSKELGKENWASHLGRINPTPHKILKAKKAKS